MVFDHGVSKKVFLMKSEEEMGFECWVFMKRQFCPHVVGV